jgi:mannose-6-phosphate isomerase-like protein (cupin superfamily)
MVKVYRSSDSEPVDAGGYRRQYVADVTLRRKLDTAGFIWVKIPGGMKTDAHKHERLEEVFFFVDSARMGVGNQLLQLEQGDVVIVEPGEAHWFETEEHREVRIIAIKLPNLKKDKVEIGA